MPSQMDEDHQQGPRQNTTDRIASMDGGLSGSGPANGAGIVMPNQAVARNPGKKAKRNRNKSAAHRGPTALHKYRGTGFEEYFADPPMTPDEALEEKLEIYAEFLPFEERIQSCIQRFRARRRLRGDQTHYFDEYLFLGGVDTSPVAYGGFDAAELKSMTPAQRRDLTATSTVYGHSGVDARFYNGDDEHWSVDFAGVAAGFFSTRLVELTGFEPEKMLLAIPLVENFLRYVLHHDVCPEYKDNVESALQICQQARIEWPILFRLRDDLPGHFHLAAAQLFSAAETSDWSFLSFTVPKDFDPKTVFLAVCALRGELETLDKFASGEVIVSKQYTCTVQVDVVERPSDELVDRFAALRVGGETPDINPVGKVHFKPTCIEDEWEQYETPTPAKDTGSFWVYLEDKLLENVMTGMKMDMTVVELNTGIRFIKTLHKILPSFYTFLPQQMMKYFTHPRELDSTVSASMLK